MTCWISWTCRAEAMPTTAMSPGMTVRMAACPMERLFVNPSAARNRTNESLSNRPHPVRLSVSLASPPSSSYVSGTALADAMCDLLQLRDPADDRRLERNNDRNLDRNHLAIFERRFQTNRPPKNRTAAASRSHPKSEMIRSTSSIWEFKKYPSSDMPTAQAAMATASNSRNL